MKEVIKMKLFRQDCRELYKEMNNTYKLLSTQFQTSRANYILGEFCDRLGTEYTFRLFNKLPRRLRNMVM
jgi:hypothetical protein